MGDEVGHADVEVKILIIAKHPKNLKNTCEHLARYGWATTCMNSITKALEFIKTDNPDLVMISFNHPSDAIHKLPDLLERDGERICIGFVEGTDAISSDTLTAVKIKNKIFGNPSGPNVQRGISQILAQMGPLKKRSPRPSPPTIVEPLLVSPPVSTIHSRARSALTLAISQICQPGGQSPLPLGNVKKVGVFRFDSAEMPGYLVFGQEPPSDTKDFLISCSTVIKQAFSNTGLPGQLSEGFWLDLPSVEFKTWASTAGAFNLTIDNGGVEMGVAFFQATAPLPVPRPVAGHDMFGIGVKQLSAGEPLPFKLYLYMQSNAKYYLYLRDGRELLPEQLERLQRRAVQEVFVKSPDLENLKQFWAQSYLKVSRRAG